MVALDEQGEPTQAPPLEPETDVELRRQHEAELRRGNRLAEREQILEHRGEWR